MNRKIKSGIKIPVTNRCQIIIHPLIRWKSKLHWTQLRGSLAKRPKSQQNQLIFRLLRFRSQRCEPVGWRVRERAPPAGLDAAKDYRTGALRRAALWYLQNPPSLKRLCFQNPRTVSQTFGSDLGYWVHSTKLIIEPTATEVSVKMY